MARGKWRSKLFHWNAGPATSLDNPVDAAPSGPDPPGSARSTLLDGLPPQEMDQVQSRLRPLACTAGTVLMAQGSWHGMMHIVRSGVLGVHVETVHGEVRQLARLVPSDCVGEMSLLTGSPASATVTALTDTELWALGHAEFLELLSTCPTLSRNMAIILSRRLSMTNRAAESSLMRRMRLRTHPDLPPELGEAIVRDVARHLGIPLLVLDARPVRCWHSDEQLPSVDSVIGDHRVADRLRPIEPAGVLAVSTLDVPSETSVRLHEWLSGHVTHVLTLIDTDQRAQELLERREKPEADVIMWPAQSRDLPPDVSDLVLVASRAQANTRRALERESQTYGVPVVRTLVPDSPDLATDLAWLARHLAGLKVGLALGGGGARGYAHLGVLDGLQRAGVPLDYLGGCSIGALVASGRAFGMRVDDMQRELDAATPHLRKFTLSRKSMLSDRGLEYIFRERLFGDTNIEDLHLPLAIVAVDVLQRHKVVMERGLIWKALLASTAIPGVYPPVWIGSHCLVDGGILDPVPADITRSLGADVVLGVRLGGVSKHEPVAIAATHGVPGGRSPHLVDVMMRSFDTMASGITSRVVEDADITLVAEVPPIGLREFGRGRTFVPAGHAALQQAWPQVTTLLPWLRDTKLNAED